MKKIRKYPELQELKGRIRAKGTSYREVALKSNISLNALNSKLNGYTSFDSLEIEKISCILGIEPADIIIYFFPSMLRNANKEEAYA